MELYQFLVGLYNAFLAIFPPSLQWLITLALVIGLVSAFLGLLRGNLVLLIVLILVLPFIAPILQHFFADIYNFFLYLIHQLSATVPR